MQEYVEFYAEKLRETDCSYRVLGYTRHVSVFEVNDTSLAISMLFLSLGAMRSVGETYIDNCIQNVILGPGLSQNWW